MAVRRSRPGARRQKAYSQIVNCRSEEQYAKVHKQAGEKGLVLVEFVAGWSTSSKTMQPYVEYLSKSAEFKKVKIVRVDIDALPALAKECNVKSLPTYQLYRAVGRERAHAHDDAEDAYREGCEEERAG